MDVKIIITTNYRGKQFESIVKVRKDTPDVKKAVLKKLENLTWITVPGRKILNTNSIMYITICKNQGV